MRHKPHSANTVCRDWGKSKHPKPSHWSLHCLLMTAKGSKGDRTQSLHRFTHILYINDDFGVKTTPFWFWTACPPTHRHAWEEGSLVMNITSERLLPKSRFTLKNVSPDSAGLCRWLCWMLSPVRLDNHCICFKYFQASPRAAFSAEEAREDEEEREAVE